MLKFLLHCHSSPCMVTYVIYCGFQYILKLTVGLLNHDENNKVSFSNDSWCLISMLILGYTNLCIAFYCVVKSQRGPSFQKKVSLSSRHFMCLSLQVIRVSISDYHTDYTVLNSAKLKKKRSINRCQVHCCRWRHTHGHIGPIYTGSQIHPESSLKCMIYETETTFQVLLQRKW